MITVFNRFMLAVCIIIVGSMLYGFNEASDGQLLKSFAALIVAYKEQ